MRRDNAWLRRVRPGAGSLFGSVGNRWRDRARRRMEPGLLRLEDRRLLTSIFDVTSAADDGSTGTLRWAIGQANATSGAVEIDFTLSTPATITLTQGQLELTNPGPFNIAGPSAALLTINGNHASRVFQVDNGVTATISGLTITGGSTTGRGGGVEDLGTLALSNVSLDANTAASGGGLDDAGTAAVAGSTLDNNANAIGFGPSAVSVNSGASLVMNASTISGNASAGLYDRGSAELTGCAVVGNQSGGVVIEGTGATATLTDCSVSGNSGVGLTNSYGVATLVNCNISGNTAAGRGGGVNNRFYATTNLTGCTLSGNSSRYGGALYNLYHASLTSCTISGNSALQGGALLNFGTAQLTACTVSGNSAPNGGGGLYNYSNHYYTSKIALTDTIVAGNTSGGSPSDIGGNDPGDVTGSYTLIGIGGSGGIVGGSNGNIVLSSLATLGLAPLGDYGGPTLTMPLLPGSAAIGTGTSAGPSTDQRGFPLDSPPDIGAFQVQSPGALVVNTTAGGIGAPFGDLSLRQALNLADLQSGNVTITFDATAFATPQTIDLTAGKVELSRTSGTTRIVGPAAGVTLNAGGMSRVLQVEKGVTATISGVTMTGGSAFYSGGGLYNSGTVTLSGCTIGGNTAGGSGGGVINRIGASLTMTNGSISGNAAPRLGGGILNFGTLNLTGVTISGNSAGLYGGGLMNGDSGQGEEGPIIIPGVATLTAVTITGNTAGAASGGGLLNAAESTLTMTNGKIQGNVAGHDGAGLYNAGTAKLVRVTISGNSARQDGGGLYNSGLATLIGCTVTGNTAESGGGIYNVHKGSLIGVVILVGTKVRGNTGGDSVGL